MVLVIEDLPIKPIDLDATGLFVRMGPLPPAVQEYLHKLTSLVTLHSPVFRCFRLRWQIGNDCMNPLTLHIETLLPDRHDPSHEVTVVFSTPIPINADIVMGVDTGAAVLFLANKVRHALREAMAHEIDEMILVRGERVFDPHAEKSRR